MSERDTIEGIFDLKAMNPEIMMCEYLRTIGSPEMILERTLVPVKRLILP